ncbi:MAG: YbhB/YbcL family Raf kinase inhibitor-like protein [Coxiellaceae bacterium]|nr:YbhB/YbcL family Raf kinase inhibitor-like protein [Coxiellaceae bacterium]
MLRIARVLRTVTATIFLLVSINAFAFTLSSSQFKNGGMLKDKQAACKYSKKQKRMVYAMNASPKLKWKKAPKKTQSFVLVVTDPDVPVDRRHVNKNGRVIAKDAPRRRVYHWIVTDIPRTVHLLKAGAGSLPPINMNKPVTQLKNSWAKIASYGDIVAFSDSYVGPCPPSNDERVHRYIFNLYALDVATVPNDLSQVQLIKFVNAHTIGLAKLIGTRPGKPIQSKK